MSSWAAGLGNFQKDQLPKAGGEPGLWESSWPKTALRANPLRLPRFLEVQGCCLQQAGPWGHLRRPAGCKWRPQRGPLAAACERGIYKDVVRGRESTGTGAIPGDGDRGMFLALGLRRREDEIRDVAKTLRQGQCRQGRAGAPQCLPPFSPVSRLRSCGPNPREAGQSGSPLMQALRPAPGHGAGWERWRECPDAQRPA